MFGKLSGKKRPRPAFVHIESVVALYEKLKMATPNGCADSDIKSFEKNIGLRIPASYFEFLNWMGNGAGQFLEGSACLFQHVPRLRQDAADLLHDNKFPVKLPDDAIIVWMHQGYQFLFIRAGEGDNPPVHWYHESLHRTDFEYQKYPSYSEFLTNELIGHAYLEEAITGAETGIRSLFKQPISVHVRDNDAEQKVLEEVAAKMCGSAGKKFPEKTGRIKLTTEHRMCIVCRYALKQFKDMFPNITVEVASSE
jgi:hypothetical protein